MRPAPLSPVTSRGMGAVRSPVTLSRGGCFVTGHLKGNGYGILRHRSPLWGMGAVFSSRHRPPLRGRDVVCALDHPPRGGRPAVVGALCSAQSHPIPAGSRFFTLAPSGPLGGQLRGAARPPTATPSPNRSALLAFPPPLPMERTCKHKAQHSGPPAAESLPERRKHEPWPPPSRRHPLGLLPRPYTAASLLTSHLHAHAPSRVTVNPQHGILWQAWGEISFRY